MRWFLPQLQYQAQAVVNRDKRVPREVGHLVFGSEVTHAVLLLSQSHPTTLSHAYS